MSKIGEIVQQFNERFNWHKLGFKNTSKYGYCKNLSKNLLKVLCREEGYYRSQMIENTEGTGRRDRGAMDPKRKELKRKKIKWITKPKTSY